MKALIVAAGQGTRLREKGELKPLIPIRGVALIERVIRTLLSAGIEEIFVVTGYRAEALQAALRRIGTQSGLPIRCVHNQEWTRANGVSVLAAKQFLDEPFLLTMCDHLVDPEIFRTLIAARAEPETVTLAVDFNIETSLNDPEDVTRVKAEDGRIRHIGKVIRDFNCFDTGVFRCTTAMFEALTESQERGDDSISGAMNVLAEWNKACVFDIGRRLWIDVDDPRAFAEAERLLDSGRL